MHDHPDERRRQEQREDDEALDDVAGDATEGEALRSEVLRVESGGGERRLVAVDRRAEGPRGGTRSRPETSTRRKKIRRISPKSAPKNFLTVSAQGSPLGLRARRRRSR